MTQTVLLGDIAELVKDSYSPRPDENLKYIGLEHINQQSLSLNGVGSSKELGSNKYRFRAGDILFGKLRPYFRKVYRPDFEGVCSTDIWVLRPKSDTDPDFLFYLIASEEFVSSSSGASTGTRMPRADWSHVSTTKWTLPNNTNEVGRILRSLDEKIELSKQMNETLEEMGQALFRNYFINNPEADDWDEKSLDEVANFLNGVAMQKFPDDGGPTLPVIKIREMSGGITSNTDIGSANIPEKYIVHDGDILFSWSGTLIVKPWCDGEGALNQHLFKVTSDEYPKWFYYFWTKYHLQSFIETAAGKATTMGHIQRRHLTDAKVKVPTVNVLAEINQIMVPILDQQIANELEGRKLAMLRDSLLPRLISGKISV